jgi:pimeloyl-ACP methyl ester carboxylesterase
MWQPQVQAFTDYHCLVPDLPEHGRSLAEKPLTIQDSAQRVAQLIRQRGHAGKAHVVGVSLGAQVIVALLSQAPEVVERALISSANLHGVPGGSLLRPGLLKATYRLAVAPFRNNAAYIRLNMRSGAAVPDEYFPQFLEDVRSGDADSFADPVITSINFRLPAGLERVHTPVLAVAGKKEPKLMQASLRDLVAAIPSAQGCLLNLPGSKSFRQEHLWNLNYPELFNKALRAWLEGRPLPPELVPLPK